MANKRNTSSSTSSSSSSSFTLCFLVFLCFFLSFSTVEGLKWPELQKGTYEIKEGTLLSQQWKVASLQFDFGEEDLSFPLVVPCFECVDKHDYEKADDDLACICDFSSKENCGSVPKGCPSSTCDSDEVEKRCDFNKNTLLKDWTELKISSTGKEEDFKLKDIQLSANEVRYFRFNARDPCRGYKVKTLFHSGLVDLLISTENYQPAELSQEWSTSSRTYPDDVEVDLCPEFVGFELGTYFVTVMARTDSVFDLHIFGQEPTIDKPVDGGDVEPCSDDETHFCMKPGDYWSTYHPVDDNKFLFFRWDIKVQKGECKTLTIYADCEDGDAGLAGDWTITTPNYYYGTNPQYHSEFAGSDILHFQRCFEDEGVVPFYFTLNQWSIGKFVLRVSEKKTSFFLSTSELTQYQYSFTASRSLIATCPGPNPQITWMCQDWRNYCKQFWPIYPAEDPQPFWPSPALWRSTNSPVSAAMFSSLVNYDTPLPNRKPGSLSYSVLLSNNFFGKEITYLTEEQLQNCTFISGNVAFNKRGYALQGTTTVEKKKAECKKDEIKELVELGRSYFEELRTAIDFSKILQLTFQVDTLKFSSTWLSCKSYSESLIAKEDVYQLTDTTSCFEPNTTSPEWLEDPCCNTGILWKACCLPRPYNISTQLYIEPDTHKISEECQNSDCVASYVSDLIELDINQFQCATFKSEEYPKLVDKSQQFYVDCKNKYNIDAISLGEATCHSDAECRFGGLSNKCNLVTGRCIASRELELATLHCIVDGMDLYTESYFKDILSLPGRKKDSEFFNAFVDYFSVRDCRNNLGHQSTLRDGELFIVMDSKCAGPYSCKSDSCLDSTCTITGTACFLNCQMFWAESDSTKESCQEQKKCNWDGEACASDCEDKCKKPKKDSFCAYCYNDAHCVEIPGINSEDECEGTEACLLLDGTIELMSKEECLKVQGCTEPCHDGMSCKSANNLDDVCASPSESKKSCTGVWRDDIDVCTYPLLSQTLCASLGKSFLSCQDLSLDECSDCYSGLGSCSVNQTRLACKVVPTTACETKKECENKGGYCDDADYYNRFGTQTDDFGSCILPLDIAGWSGALPQCRSKAMVPQGCAPLAYTSKETCLNTPSSFWHPMAKTKDECLTATGCITFDQINVHGQLPEKECTACGKETEVIFHWTPAKWTTATPTKLQWQKREVVSLFQWAPTVDFISLQSILVESIQATVISDLRSQALCDFSARSTIFEVVACSCSGEEGGKDCFGSSSKAVESGSGRPCIGIGSTIQNPLATVLISEEAISIDASSRCTPVTLYTESIFNLEQGKQASFSPLTKVRQYDSFNIVLNNDRAIVGRVMSDGLKVVIEGELEAFKLCLQVSENAGDPPANFDHWDVGTRRSDDEFLKPLGLSPYNVTLEVSGAKRYCFEIEDPNPEGQKSQTYHLIARLEEYENQDGSLYGSEAAAWWTFAALYTILAIFSLLTFVLHFFGYPLHFYFLGLFLFFFFMCVIRAVYFYLLAAQVFDDGSALAVAYFLIEFPTLLYFTAFSCLGAFWIFLLYAHFQSRTQRFILGGAIFFNLLLYILFVVLLILFETLSSNTSSACPGRIPEEEDNTTQQIISIFYQSFMAGVSLLLAVVVTIYGGRLLISLKKRNFEGKVAIVTAFCALGLLLHCAFILYLSIKYTYDFTIIVLMIVLSELVPIFAITLQFSFIRRTSKLPGYNKRANFIKAFWRNFTSGSSGNETLTRFSTKTGTSTQTSTASAIAKSAGAGSAEGSSGHSK